MASHKSRRYNERSVAELFNSRLKEEFGGRNVMVPGTIKRLLHLMFGVASLFNDHLIEPGAYCFLKSPVLL
jgi:hypothetical protein